MRVFDVDYLAGLEGLASLKPLARWYQSAVTESLHRHLISCRRVFFVLPPKRVAYIIYYNTFDIDNMDKHVQPSHSTLTLRRIFFDACSRVICVPSSLSQLVLDKH